MSAPKSLLRRVAVTFVGLVLVGVMTGVIAQQVQSRDDFANSELSQGVEERWGAPVDQPAPSVRYVESGTIFTELAPLPLARQHVTVDASMSYRKRGLRYFSGFDFTFTGRYAIANPRDTDIEVVFVFPLEVNKAQVLMSDLQFLVAGEPAPLELGEQRDRLVWTGRIAKGATVELQLRYRARGLDRFTYRLDPSLPARDVKLHVGVVGGENFDYPSGALAATEVHTTRGATSLDWAFSSLEAGVTLGVILPSQQAWDSTIATMAVRAWCPYLGLAVLLSALGVRHRRALAFYESLLLAALFGFHFVVTAYLSAFMPFFVAWPLTLVGLGAAFTAYVKRLFPAESVKLLAGLWVVTMVVPTAAVVAQGYTGLIYTVELLATLLAAMVLSTRASVRAWLDDALRKSPGATP